MVRSRKTNVANGTEVLKAEFRAQGDAIALVLRRLASV